MADSDSAILYAMQIKQAVVRVTNVIWIFLLFGNLFWHLSMFQMNSTIKAT